MRRINSIILLFFSLVIVTFVVFWQVLHSEKFAQFVLKRTDKYLPSSLQGKLHMDHFDFKFYPPGIELTNVKLKDYKLNGNELDLFAGALGVEFDIFTFTDKRIKVSNIYIKDASVEIDSVNGKPSKRTEQTSIGAALELKKWHGKIYQLLTEDLPVEIKQLSLFKTNLHWKDYSTTIEQLSFQKQEKHYSITIEVENLPQIDTFVITPNIIDEVKINAKWFEDKIAINQFNIKSFSSKLDGKLTIVDIAKKITNWKVFGNISLEGNVLSINKIFQIPQLDTILKNGDISVNSLLAYQNSKLRLKGNLALNNLISSYLDAKSIKTDFEISEKVVTGSNLVISKDGKKAQVSVPEKFTVYDYSTNRILSEPFGVHLNSAPTTWIFKFLKNTLNPIKGEINGDVKISSLEGEGFNLGFFIEEPLVIENFALKFNEEKPIISNDSLKLKNTDFKLQNGVLTIDGLIQTQETYLPVKGTVAKGNLHFTTVNSAYLALQELGPFAGVSVKGKGPIDLSINVDQSDAVLKLQGNMRKFSVIGFQLGDAKVDAAIDLKTLEININEVKSNLGQGMLTGGGVININNEPHLQLAIDLNDVRFRRLLDVYDPLISQLPYIPKFLAGKFDHHLEIQGGFEVPKLNINGTLNGSNILLAEENIAKLKLDFEFFNNRVTIKDFLAKKLNGRFFGSGMYDLNNGTIDYDFRLKELPLREMATYRKTPFGVSGILEGVFRGKGTVDKPRLINRLNLNETYISGQKQDDSTFYLYLQDNLWTLAVNFFGTKSRLRGIFDLAEENNSSQRNSILDLRIDLPEWPLIFGVVLNRQVPREILKGSMALNLHSEFNFQNLKQFDLDFTLEKFIFVKDELKYRVLPESDSIKVENGKIREWDVQIVRVDNAQDVLISEGKGSFEEDYNIKTFFRYNAELLDLFSAQILASSGSIISRLVVKKKKKDANYLWLIEGDDLYVNHSSLPEPLSKAKFKINVRNKKLFLEKFAAQWGGGSVNANGEIFWKDGAQINLNYDVDKTNISFMDKSNIIISAKGSLNGDKFPYNFSGTLDILGAQIRNEPDEFAQKEKSIRENRYLPQSNLFDAEHVLELHQNINLVNPVVIQNQMMFLKFYGDMNVAGYLDKPNLVGRLYLKPKESSLYFRGNEFVLQKGELVFRENQVEINPEVYFLAVADINEYKISMRLFGALNDFKMELYSEPALSQNDILSLLTLGFTSEVSQGLGDSDRQALTSAGIGSLLLEQFKIGKALKNTLGVKLNVSSEIERSDQNVLEHRRTGDSGDAVSLRSATKIELSKQISKKVNMSVSGTVGGSIGQKQQMNLDYQLDDNIIASGLYESRSNTDSEEETSDTALGVELRFKWTLD